MKPIMDVWAPHGEGQNPMSTWSWLGSAPNSSTRSIRQIWGDLLEASGDPFGIYQSPEWFDVERGEAGREGQPTLAIRRDRKRQMVGIVPLYKIEDSCLFPLILGRNLVSGPQQMIHIPSGCLLLPPGDRWFDSLFASLDQRGGAHRVVKISRVPVSGLLHSYLENSAELRRRYCAYVEPGLSKVHMIPLPRTYDEFLSAYSSKKRYNLRRQMRQLEQNTKGSIELRTFESADDVPQFFEFWEQVRATRNSPSPIALPPALRDARHRRIADAGLFLSFALLDGSRPIAIALGHRFRSTFMLLRTLHDPAYNDHSPGACLHHMVIERLIEGLNFRLMNLGFGDPTYEHRATNVICDFSNYWLIPATWKNRLFQAGYRGFRRGVIALKSRWGHLVTATRQWRRGEDAE